MQCKLNNAFKAKFGTFQSRTKVKFPLKCYNRLHCTVGNNHVIRSITFLALGNFSTMLKNALALEPISMTFGTISDLFSLVEPILTIVLHFSLNVTHVWLLLALFSQSKWCPKIRTKSSWVIKRALHGSVGGGEISSECCMRITLAWKCSTVHLPQRKGRKRKGKNPVLCLSPHIEEHLVLFMTQSQYSRASI